MKVWQMSFASTEPVSISGLSFLSLAQVSLPVFGCDSAIRDNDDVAPLCREVTIGQLGLYICISDNAPIPLHHWFLSPVGPALHRNSGAAYPLFAAWLMPLTMHDSMQSL